MVQFGSRYERYLGWSEALQYLKAIEERVKTAQLVSEAVVNTALKAVLLADQVAQSPSGRLRSLT